jgi:hypothetical protein
MKMKSEGLFFVLRGVGTVASVIALSVGTAPLAQARSLQDIYQDMLTANKQQPCSHGVYAFDTAGCLDSTITKQRLVAEVAPLLQAMPAPPRSTVENAQAQLQYLQEMTDEWTASHCLAFPNVVDKINTCTGADIQEWFDAVTGNVGQIVQSI